MARATIQFEGVGTTRDIVRFLETLDLVGIDVDGDHPVRVFIGGSGSGNLSASLSVDALAVSANEL